MTGDREVGPIRVPGTGMTEPDPRRWRALALLCLAGFMVILDTQIVILALPSIERSLGFAVGDVQWVLTAYLLGFGGLLLPGGRAADVLGRRRMFMVGTAVFLVSSLLCGLAWAGGVLVAARVVQAVSAAILAPTALSILMTLFEEGPARNRALAIWSGSGAFGATAALLIGGAVTTALGWEWIFFMNVPVAVLMLGLSPVLLPESRNRHRERSHDLAGALTITAALTLLIFALTRAPAVGWVDTQTVGLLAGSACLLALFLAIERGSRAPLAPLRIFRSRALVGGNALTIVVAMLAFGVSFVMSRYAQQVLGYSPLLFGVATAIMPVMAAVGAYTGQAVVTRVGPRPVAIAGMLLFGTGCLLLTPVPLTANYVRDIFVGMFVFGLGLGACSVAAPVAALSGVAESEAGLASGINTAAFQIGGAVGVALVSTVVVSYTAGPEPLLAMTAGFRAGLSACVILAGVGLVVAVTLLGKVRRSSPPRSHLDRSG